MGESSNPTLEVPAVNYPTPNGQPSVNVEEFSACCLLANVWGEAIPLSAIIHRTYNE